MGLCFIFKPCPVSNIYYASKAHKYKNNLSFFLYFLHVDLYIRQLHWNKSQVM